MASSRGPVRSAAPRKLFHAASLPGGGARAAMHGHPWARRGIRGWCCGAHGVDASMAPVTERGSAGVVRFGPFRLDPLNARLWRGDQALRLTPKAFGVLAFLVSRAGRLLTAVWPEVTVSEAALTVCIREIRQVLKDDAHEPRLIETVNRRGFRFAGGITPDGEATPDGRAEAVHIPRGAVVARDAEVARMHEWFARARRGERQMVFVTGEAGIGKTTVVETFLASLTGSDAPWIARGQCIEYLGAGEAYLPVLDAIGGLAKLPEGDQVVALLSRHAPSWLAQMPGLVSGAETEVLHRRIADATRGRMLREMADALEALSVGRPLVLVLEDLHWSDHATLDLLAWLARGREPARLLVLGTYRPVDAIVRAHPLRAIVLELARQRRSEELPLELLAEAEVGRYLAVRFPDSRIPAVLVSAIHGHTDGNPLFMVTVVDSLAQQGWLAPVEGGWEARPGAEQAAMAVPASLSQMVGLQFEALSADDQALLESASVAGLEFSAASAASGVEAAPDAVEARCADLARRAQFLQGRGNETWPDGTLSGRYGFIHALYQHVVYGRVPAGRRAQLHRRIGIRLESGHGERVAEHAGELARHFLEGQDVERALGYLLRAAENAQGRAAYREAVSHLTQGIEVIERLPATAERARRELDFQTALGPLLMALRGFAAPEVERTYNRARALCAEAGEARHLFATLWGLCVWHVVRGQPAAGRELAVQLLDLAQRDQSVTLLAHLAYGLTLYYVGELAEARGHLDRATALYRPEEHRALTRAVGQQNPGVTAHRYGAWTLWALGYPERAVQRANAALTLARELGHPPSIVASLAYLARLHQFRGDAARTRECAESTIALAREQGFAQRLAAATILAGWSQVAAGSPEGLEAMVGGLADFRATGAGDDIPYWLALLADARLAVGQGEAASRDLDEALALVSANELRVWEAEIHRLRGEARLASGPGDPAAAEAGFLEALVVARRQSARGHELRAAMSLARLWRSTARRGEAGDLLAETYGWFTEGFDTADLTAARALLEGLGRPAERRESRPRPPKPSS